MTFYSNLDRARVQTILLAILLYCYHFPALAVNNSNLNVEEFKKFLSSPPPISSIIWERRNSRHELVVRQFAKWKPDAFLIQVDDSLEDISLKISSFDPRCVSAGMFKTKFWLINSNNITFSPVGNPTFNAPGIDEATALAKNPIVENAGLYGLSLDTVMHLGISGSEQGSLQWSGDILEGRSIYGGKIHGELIVKDSRPWRLKIVRTNDTIFGKKESSNIIIEYESYSTNQIGCEYIPTSIKTYVDKHDKMVFRGEILIQKISIATQVEDASFDPIIWLEGKQEKVLYYSKPEQNSDLFVKDQRSVRLKKVSTVRDVMVVRQDSGMQVPGAPSLFAKRTVIWMFLVISSVIMGFIILRISKEKQQNKENEIHK